jgi:hypothetical protein
MTLVFVQPTCCRTDSKSKGSSVMLAHQKAHLRRGPIIRVALGCQIELELALLEHYETCWAWEGAQVPRWTRDSTAECIIWYINQHKGPQYIQVGHVIPFLCYCRCKVVCLPTVILIFHWPFITYFVNTSNSSSVKDCFLVASEVRLWIVFLLKWLNTGLKGSSVYHHHFVAIVAYCELRQHACSNPLVVLDHRLKISCRFFFYGNKISANVVRVVKSSKYIHWWFRWRRP